MSRHDLSLRVLLSIGANVGNPTSTVIRAMSLIEERGILRDCRRSALYQTEPLGFTEQPTFINSCLSGDTDTDPHTLRHVLSTLETELGRIPRARWHEREIDIDIILFGSTVAEDEQLSLPHPRMNERLFVLKPASDIEPLMVHPHSGLSIEELLAMCPDTSSVLRLDTYPDSILRP